MDEVDSPETPALQFTIGRLFFAASIVASGIFQLVTGRFVNLVPVHPGPLPPSWQPWLFGVVFILIGAGLLVRKTVSAAAITLAALLLVLFFGFGLPLALAHASSGFVWVDPLMMLALLGGVSLAAARRGGSPASDADRVFEKATHFAPLTLGVFLAYCGAAHFPYAEYVAGLIPPWIPWHLFWTYVAGVALIAGGVGVLVPRTTRLAATMSGILLFSWVFLVHIPLAIRTQNAGEVSRGFQALSDSGVAFMLAALRIHKRRNQ